MVDAGPNSPPPYSLPTSRTFDGIAAYENVPPRSPNTPAANGYGHRRAFTQSETTIGRRQRDAIANLSAVERSQRLRVIRMNPHLQFMAGPLLRYDTVDTYGTWHGFCLIVSKSPRPTFTAYIT